MSDLSISLPPSTSQGRPIFLFTDIEGSTPLWEKYRETMLAALLQHNAILEQQIPKHGGRILELRGDGVKAVFEGVDPLPCVLDIQREFGRANWGQLGELKIRIGLHGVPSDLAGHDYFVKDGKYFGPVLNQAARIMDASHGGQILVSEPVRMRFNLPPGASWQDFGLHHFKGIDEPLKVYGLRHPDLPHQEFPPLRLPSEQPDRPESELERPPQPEPVIPHNLPHRLTSFVGREKEMAAITALINQHRLLMLTGTGGIGKTDLCLQVGRKLLAAFPDGVWLVELAPLADPTLLPQAAAYALGLREASDLNLDAADPGLRALPSRSILQRLLNYLQERHCLLILDNCEHLIKATAEFAETLLQACPEVKILASSREALGVPGELPFQVPPLSIPNSDQLPALDAWHQYDALRLFVDRAATVLPTFRVTPANITHLVQICQRLDGIPLALELAAARIKVLTAEQIAARLDDRFRLLTGGSRTALPRQQTLHALIDWSWELLTAAEQLLLPRLSVFAGGMTLEAVEAVCAGDGLDVYDMLDLLSELVNKSLVMARREQAQETRYQLLETIRQYAQERLEPTGQRATLRQRHLNYFLHLGEQAGAALFGPDQAVWLLRLEQELDNLRLALKWAQETDREAGIRLITTVWPFWDGRYVGAGEAWLVKLLAQAELIAPDIKAQAFWVSGRFNRQLGHFDRARLLLEKSLALYQELSDAQGIARCRLFMTWFIEPEERQAILWEYLTHFRASGDTLDAAEVLRYLGFFAGQQNNYEQARLYLRESESLYRELGHLSGIADVLNDLGTMAIWQEDYDRARPLLEESLAIDEELGSRGSSNILLHLGLLHFRQGDDQRARMYLEKSLSLSQQTGDYHTSCWILAHLGYVCLREGELAQARHFFLKSLRKFREMEYKIGVDFTLEGLASLAVSQKQAARAVRLFAWTEATRKTMQNPRPPIEQADVERDMAAIREMIDEEAYAAAYAEGKTMTMEKAIACALEIESS
jgi:predicted ATPase/class 3 adenylate cyclase/Tfp pilus assembly protein PilF